MPSGPVDIQLPSQEGPDTPTDSSSDSESMTERERVASRREACKQACTNAGAGIIGGINLAIFGSRTIPKSVVSGRTTTMPGTGGPNTSAGSVISRGVARGGRSVVGGRRPLPRSNLGRRLTGKTSPGGPTGVIASTGAKVAAPFALGVGIAEFRQCVNRCSGG